MHMCDDDQLTLKKNYYKVNSDFGMDWGGAINKGMLYGSQWVICKSGGFRIA